MQCICVRKIECVILTERQLSIASKCAGQTFRDKIWTTLGLKRLKRTRKDLRPMRVTYSPNNYSYTLQCTQMTFQTKHISPEKKRKKKNNFPNVGIAHALYRRNVSQAFPRIKLFSLPAKRSSVHLMLAWITSTRKKKKEREKRNEQKWRGSPRFW